MPENGSVNGGPGRDAPDSSRDTDNDRGGAREDKESRAEKAESFDRAMDNANRPDRAPSAPPDTTTASDDGDDDRNTTDRLDDRQDRAAGPPGIGAPPSSPSPTDTTNEPDDTDDLDDRGVLDRASDFFGGLARDMQDFARENPRVDSHGNTVGLVDADGIQRGEVASGVRSSGTSSEDLARQLGFSSPQDMATAQNTGFIEDQYQADKAVEMEAAIADRYGHIPPDVQIVLANSTLPITEKMPVMALDDMAKTGARNVTRALGPLGFIVNLAIDIVSPTPVADGTLKSEETEGLSDIKDGERSSVPIGDLEPLHDAETSGKRPELEGLSDEELLDAVEKPKNGDTVKVNTENGKVVDGNGRIRELQERAKDPSSSITPETEITVEGYTPDNTAFDWDK